MREFRESLIKSEKIFQIGLIVVMLGLSYLVLKQLSFLIDPLLWAITFFITLKPAYINLVEKKGLNKYLASSFLILILLVFILIFITISYLIINAKAVPLLQNQELFKQTILSAVANIQGLLPVGFDIVQNVAQFIPKIANYFFPLIKNIGTVLIDIVFTVIMLGILFVNYKYIRTFAEKVLPFTKKSSDDILDRFEKLVRGNMVAIPLVAFSQGILGFIGYWIFGFSLSNALVFGFLTAVSSIIPVIGTAIVYVPLALYIGLTDMSLLNGLGVFLWGFLIIGFSDNLARAFFQNRISKVSIWYTIIGTVVGIKVFGLSGLIFGPILLMLVVSLWKLYYNHFGLYREDYEKREIEKVEEII